MSARPAYGYPFTGHASQAVILGIKPADVITPGDRLWAAYRVAVHVARAASAIAARKDVLYLAHANSADRLAAKYQVAWEDPAVVRCPLQERQT